MPDLGYSAALAVLRRGVDVDLHHVLTAALSPLDGHDPVVYLVDFGHRVLMPLPVAMSGPIPAEEDVATTLAGRAFTTGQPMTAERDGEARVWVPVLQGSERTGVLAVTVPAIDPDVLAELALLGVFAGLTISCTATVSDIPHLRRRGRTMSLAATMQWELMPPLAAATDRVAVAGVLEPAYDIAGVIVFGNGHRQGKLAHSNSKIAVLLSYLPFHTHCHGPQQRAIQTMKGLIGA